MKTFWLIVLLLAGLAPLAGCVVVERRDGYYFRPLPYYRYPYRYHYPYRPYYSHHGPRFDD